MMARFLADEEAPFHNLAQVPCSGGHDRTGWRIRKTISMVPSHGSVKSDTSRRSRVISKPRGDVDMRGNND